MYACAVWLYVATNRCVTCYGIIYKITRYTAVGSAGYFTECTTRGTFISLFLDIKAGTVDCRLSQFMLTSRRPWSWFNYNVNVCMYCFCSESSQFFSCFCSKSSQVILLTPSRLKSILSHFSSSASQFSTNKVTPRSVCALSNGYVSDDLGWPLTPQTTTIFAFSSPFISS